MERDHPVDAGDAIEKGDADVEDALRAERVRASYLEGGEAAGARFRAEGGEEDADGAKVGVLEAEAKAVAGGKDVDGDGGGYGEQEGVVHAEDELVVPGGVGMAGPIRPRRQFLVRVDPRNRIGPHGPGRRREQVLGRDHRQLNEVARHGRGGGFLVDLVAATPRHGGRGAQTRDEEVDIIRELGRKAGEFHGDGSASG